MVLFISMLYRDVFVLKLSQVAFTVKLLQYNTQVERDLSCMQVCVTMYAYICISVCIIICVCAYK